MHKPLIYLLLLSYPTFPKPLHTRVLTSINISLAGSAIIFLQGVLGPRWCSLGIFLWSSGTNISRRSWTFSCFGGNSWQAIFKPAESLQRRVAVGDHTGPTTIYWLLPQLFLLGAMERLVEEGLIAFIIDGVDGADDKVRNGIALWIPSNYFIDGKLEPSVHT